MNLFPYREEPDPELLRAAQAAYAEAPPAHNTRISLFAWSVGRRPAPEAEIPRGDQAEAA